jgi:hypothetical protein
MASDTPPQKVEHILCEDWKIRRPRAIISIIGGTQYFKLNEQLESNFIGGVIEIARKTGRITNSYI